MDIGHLATLAGFAAIALALVMAGAWAVQRRTGNSGWIDATWSFGVAATALACALWPFSDVGWRQMLVAALVAAWGLRLGIHIAGRTAAASDDPRYRALIEEWGDDAPRRLFWFLQAQAAVGLVLVLSVALAAHNPAPDLRIQDAVGAALLALAIGGEAIADRQLASFRSDPSNRGRVCDTGLWSWSRHPNYFFEWLGWVAYPVIAVDFAGHNPLGAFAIVAPLCMYWVLVHVSGIPPLEAHMLRSRGRAFRDYQERTSPFFPRKPR